MGGRRAPLPSRAKPSSHGRGRLLFDVDRIIVMRVVVAIVVVAFLYLILKVSMIAFGGSSARGAKRIERAVDPNAARTAADVAAPSKPEPAPVR
jgi:predicted metal-binding membrane protein